MNLLVKLHSRYFTMLLHLLQLLGLVISIQYPNRNNFCVVLCCYLVFSCFHTLWVNILPYLIISKHCQKILMKEINLDYSLGLWGISIITKNCNYNLGNILKNISLIDGLIIKIELSLMRMMFNLLIKRSYLTKFKVISFKNISLVMFKKCILKLLASKFRHHPTKILSLRHQFMFTINLLQTS